ncbi:MAG: DUF4433 domain-containing protein [Nitrospira sp. SB0675_bin_23]|nr:DUF4433 domain-containing protein [Nitrospira sp. SB0667_bin_9]MYD30210.1 DUF4433 domain-containing protein [Nitrospira sp. SB0661_bin_20]MYH01001.1 DUF4433 domain-containing protein [Nitrospira sp. SB0675_bin_23]MYJ23578.1 DUF4433 domain-containing protein [Nitrospira sp. SB0673_bin_12]
MPIPNEPKIYHIVHIDRLASIVADDCLWCDAKMSMKQPRGTTIGMNSIKERRLTNALNSHPDVCVGDCVPFYFCPRSVMLYVISQANHLELKYRGGQDPIVHLEADLQRTVAWAEQNKRRWAFTTSNAGSRFFDDYADLADLDKVDWNAVHARDWQNCKDGKQAEFLLEDLFPWEMVSRIGVNSKEIYAKVLGALHGTHHRPTVEVLPDWYY